MIDKKRIDCSLYRLKKSGKDKNAVRSIGAKMNNPTHGLKSNPKAFS